MFWPKVEMGDGSEERGGVSRQEYKRMSEPSVAVVFSGDTKLVEILW